MLTVGIAEILLAGIFLVVSYPYWDRAHRKQLRSNVKRLFKRKG